MGYILYNRWVVFLQDSAATAEVFIPAVTAFFRRNANLLSPASGVAGQLEA